MAASDRRDSLGRRMGFEMPRPAPPFVPNAVPACTGADIRLFFPDPHENTSEARRICSNCPALAECDEYAMTHFPQGIWAGKSARDRALDRKRAYRENSKARAV